MQATITIKLGNAAMLTTADISDALDKLGTVLRENWEPKAGDTIRIRDGNGNVVGSYNVTEAP